MFFITSVRARIIKGAMAGGLRMVRDMLGDSTGKAPNDMRVRVLWNKMTEKAKIFESKKDMALAKNIYFFRDAFCWLADTDASYTKIVTDALREIVKSKNDMFILACSTGDEATVSRLLVRKAQLEASGVLKKEPKSYKSDPTSLLIGM